MAVIKRQSAFSHNRVFNAPPFSLKKKKSCYALLGLNVAEVKSHDRPPYAEEISRQKADTIKGQHAQVGGGGERKKYSSDSDFRTENSF